MNEVLYKKMLDTHKSVRNLERAGFTDAQSEAFVNVLVDALENNANSIKMEIRQDIKELRFQMDSNKKDLENQINMMLVKVTGTVFSLMLAFKILEKFI
jgi:hypothetical protein